MKETQIEKQTVEEMAEMLDIIAKAREEYANDVTDHTENEYIREGLLNAGYRKQSVGEWVTLDECANEGVYCSACHKKVYKKDYANVKARSPYCPNCGAKMKGGAEG